MTNNRNFSIAILAVTLVALSLGSQAIHGAAPMAATPTGVLEADRPQSAAHMAGTQSALSDDLLPPEDGKALLRFAHGAPGAPAMDVLIDGLTLASAITYGNAVGYKALPAGVHHLTLQTGGKTVFETEITLPGKTAFTAVAQGLLEAKDKRAFTVAFYKDDVSETNYKVRLTVIYAIPGDLSVSDESNVVNVVRLDPASGKVIDRLYRNLNYGEITPGFLLDKGDYRFGLQAPADEKNTLTDARITTETGMVYTAIVVGYAGTPKAELTTLLLSTKGLRYYPTAVPGTLAATAVMGGTMAATLAATAR